MALVRLPGGVIYDDVTGTRVNEPQGVNLEAVHRQLGAQATAAMDALKTKADIAALNTVRATAQAAQATALDARTTANTAQATSTDARATAQTARATSLDARATATTASSVAGSAQTAAGNAVARVTALEAAAGFGPSTPTDGTIAAYVGQSSSQAAAAVDARARARTRTLYPEDFGAVGDGTTDDTAALEAWLASDSLSLRMGAGLYSVSRGLTSTASGRTIWSDGGWIRCGLPGATVLTVTGANTRVRLMIDGLNRASIGVEFRAGGGDSSSTRAVNLHAVTGNAAGIRAATAFGHRVCDAYIENVVSVGDNIHGNANAGVARGIYIGTSGVGASLPSLIERNEIREIRGEDGNSIQVIADTSATNPGEPFADMMTTIRGNRIYGFSRRAMKLQASGLVVEDNECVDLGTEKTGSEESVIALIDVHGGIVRRNRLRGPRFPMGLTFSNSGGKPYALRSAVTDNDVEIGSTGTALFVSGMEGGTITGNRTRGGAIGVNIVNFPGCKVEDNAASDTPRPVVIPNTGAGAQVSRNRGLGNAAGKEEVYVPDVYSSVTANSYNAATVPTGTMHQIVWGGWAGTAATQSETGVITPRPGRYLIQATVAGQPAAAVGTASLYLVHRTGGVIRRARSAVSNTHLQSWSVSAVATFVQGDYLVVRFEHTTGTDMSLNTTLQMPHFSMERID